MIIATPAKAEAPLAPPPLLDPILEKIAWCESHNNPKAKNPNSSASGRFQFLQSSWRVYGIELWGSLESKNIFSYVDSTELAYYVAKKYGYSSWNDSKNCWRDTLNS